MVMKAWLKNFFKSFGYAWVGIAEGIGGRNLQIQALCGALVILLGLLLGLSYTEWLVVLPLIFIVLATELLNTAIEETCNVIRDNSGLEHHGTKKARDIAAGAVLSISFGAAIVGIMIFFPKILRLF